MDELQSPLFIAILLAFLCTPADSFLPNHLNGFLGGKKNDDYTHEDITEIGILQVVAKMMEEDTTDGKNFTAGSLTSLNPLTPQKLFDKYYGVGVQATKLKSAIDEVVTANNRVDLEQADSAKYHFNGEQIKEGNLVLQTLRDNLIALLKSPSPDYSAAREMVGKYLHTLQMFYSNTNWVEMKGEAAYEDLGITGRPLMAVAPLNLPTCKNCETSPLGVRDPCDGNIIVRDILTSGYKPGQDVTKPLIIDTEGKCSHGGAPDTTRFFAATGGINKDTSDVNLSPHHDLHVTAAKAAIKATVLFFDNKVKGTGLRQIIGDGKVKELLNMGSGRSLVLVIDISGSMSNDIAAVKVEVNKLIRKTAGTPNAPYNYVLSTFSDPPNLGNVRVTKDSNEFQKWIADLRVAGGGDCPEYSMLGIERALSVALTDSTVYVFTDADAKDPQRLDGVLAMIKAKNIKLEFLLTGKCSVSKRSKSGQNGNQIKRHRRSSGSDIYAILAKKSGGGVINTDKKNIDDVSRTLTEESMGTSTTVSKFNLAPNDSNNFYVDNTMVAISVHVTSDPSVKPQIQLFDSEGSLATNFTTVVDSFGIKILFLSTPIPGPWTIITDHEDYSVEVKASTSFGFRYSFIEEKLPGYWLPVDSNPIIGKNVTIVIETVGHDHIDSLKTVQLLSVNTGDIIQSSSLVRVEGRVDINYRAQVVLNDEAVRIAVFGYDKENNTVERTAAAPVEADSAKLEVYGTSGDVRPGSTVTVKFNLINFDNDATTLSVNARTNAGFSAHAQPSRFPLKYGETGRGTITLSIPSNATPFTSTMLLVSVTDSEGKTRTDATRRMLILEAIKKTTTSSTGRTTVAVTTSGAFSVKQTTGRVVTTELSTKLLVTHSTTNSVPYMTDKSNTHNNKGDNIHITINEGFGTWEIVAIATGSALCTLLLISVVMFMMKKRLPLSLYFRQRKLSDISMVSTDKIPY